MDRRLYRSETDSMIAGVCGGLGEYFDIDPVWVRLIFVILAIFSGGLWVVAYIVLWIIMPRKSSIGAHPRDVARENVEDLRERARQFGEDIRATFSREEPTTSGEAPPPEPGVPPAPPTVPSYTPPPHTYRSRRSSSYIIAIVLIVIGAILLLGNLNVFFWLQWRYLWPLILVAIGVALLLRRREA